MKEALDKKIVRNEFPEMYSGAIDVKDVREAIKELKEEIDNINFTGVAHYGVQMEYFEKVMKIIKKHFGTLADDSPQKIRVTEPKQECSADEDSVRLGKSPVSDISSEDTKIKDDDGEGK